MTTAVLTNKMIRNFKKDVCTINTLSTECWNVVSLTSKKFEVLLEIEEHEIVRKAEGKAKLPGYF